MTIKKVKDILGSAPISIQLRDIGNICWIGQRIVEILVDVQHVERMKNHIINFSEYNVKSKFDALSPECFKWEGDILPESKEAVLKRKFVIRLAASVGSSNRNSTRQQIMHWATHRGLGEQLGKELAMQGIILGEEESDSERRDSGFLPDHQAESTVYRNPGHPLIVSGAGKYVKRKFSILSDDSIER